MNLINFELQYDNHFVAMEYYNLIMNRTFLILLTKNHLIGIKGNGFIGTESGDDLLTQLATRSIVVRGDLMNPYSYIKAKYIRKIENEDFHGRDFLLKEKSNFIINRNEIINVRYDSTKKWGMGYYPHDGKIYIETKNTKKREFIILGNQSGYDIAHFIMSK